MSRAFKKIPSSTEISPCLIKLPKGYLKLSKDFQSFFNELFASYIVMSRFRVVLWKHKRFNAPNERREF